MYHSAKLKSPIDFAIGDFVIYRSGVIPPLRTKTEPHNYLKKNHTYSMISCHSLEKELERFQSLDSFPTLMHPIISHR